MSAPHPGAPTPGPLPRLIGLTGGIASGKSTVSAMFRELGARVLDADVFARKIVEPGQPALEEISRRFPGVVDATGKLDRKALGARIFGHPDERRALEAITHPRIHQAFRDEAAALGAAGVPVVLYDAALLIENRLHEQLEGVILVSIPRELQISRLQARDGLSREEAEARVRAQLSLDDKRQHATWVVDNSGTREETQAQVERVWSSVKTGRTPGMLPGP